MPVPYFTFFRPDLGIVDPQIQSFANSTVANPLLNIHEIFSFICGYGVRKCFKFDAVWCVNNVFLKQNIAIGCSPAKFLGALNAKTIELDPVKSGYKILYLYAKFGGDQWT